MNANYFCKKSKVLLDSEIVEKDVVLRAQAEKASY